ncbi:MAG: hypothetical protein RLZZ118_856 [Bacteroidota bacterium]|jgi:hypothetical protein
MTKFLTILLMDQGNPLAPITSLVGMFIAMIWLFTRKNKKDNENDNKMK